MTEIKLTLNNPERTVAQLRCVADGYLDKKRTEGMVGPGYSATVHHIADLIEAQLPKAAVEEPTADFSVIEAVPAFGDVRRRLVLLRGIWTDLNGNGCGRWKGLNDVEVLRVGIGERPSYVCEKHEIEDCTRCSPSPAEAVEADKAGEETTNKVTFTLPANFKPERAPARLTLSADEVERLTGEPSPVQVEAEPPSLTSLPPGSVILANVRRWSGSLQWPTSTERVTLRLDANGYWEAPDGDHAAPFTVPPQCAEYIDLIEVVDTLAPAEDDPIEALVQEAAGELRLFSARQIEALRSFAARVLEVGGQQPGVPVEKVRALAEFLRQDHPRKYVAEVANDAAQEAFRQAADDLEALLPEEPTS